MKIEGVTQEKFDAAKVAIAAQSDTAVGTGNDGAISGHGVSATYSYSPATEELDVEVTHKPFYIPESAIEHQIAEYFA